MRESGDGDGTDDSKEVYEEVWFIIVVFVVTPLVLIGAVITAIWAKKTGCGKKPCREKNPS